MKLDLITNNDINMNYLYTIKRQNMLEEGKEKRKMNPRMLVLIKKL